MAFVRKEDDIYYEKEIKLDDILFNILIKNDF